MNKELKEKFLTFWQQYFNKPELPITFYYTDEPGRAEEVEKSKRRHCIIEELAAVRMGKSLRFEFSSLICPGSRRYLGYSKTLAPNFEYFLSCGIPSKLEGERYKKTPDLVKQFIGQHEFFEAPAKYIVFKRWDALNEQDTPDVAIFFARPDVLSGLFTLANFDRADFNGAVSLFGSACMNTVLFPFQETREDNPRAFIGTFDPSARPFVPADILTFSLPLKRLETMIDNAPERFLTTPTWKVIQDRIK